MPKRAPLITLRIRRHAGALPSARWASARSRLGLSLLLGALCLIAGRASLAVAQQPPVHYLHSADLPPGTVARGQLARDPLLSGHVQPVEVLLPEGVRISPNIGGQFDEPRPGPARFGMLIGPVYQFKVTHIPFREGMEVFPTIEVINRLHPPPGQAACFPVPVQLTIEELDFALEGRYVTRVIYLEDVETALPVRDDPHHQRFFEVPPGQDPLLAADQLGRPMAILRMGSRIPDEYESIRHCPPILLLECPPEGACSPTGPPGVEAAIERSERDIPRVFFPARSSQRGHPAGGPHTR